MKSSGLFEEAALTCFVPIIRDSRTFYTGLRLSVDSVLLSCFRHLYNIEDSGKKAKGKG
ncbi:MAG: hypothetical protein R2861_06190 [Desulfobacterales bacterium]